MMILGMTRWTMDCTLKFLHGLDAYEMNIDDGTWSDRLKVLMTRFNLKVIL